MINTIKKIFLDNQAFKIENFNYVANSDNINGFVALDTREGKTGLFMVIEVNELNVLLNENEVLYETFYSELRGEEYYLPEFNKNISLIILLDTQLPIEQKIKRQIFEIEENPFYFKKYVLQYTEEQHNDLIEKCEDITTENLRNLVLNVDFEEFKKDISVNNYVNLLLNLYVKLPFLNVPYSAQELPDLTETIMEILGQNSDFQDLNEYREKVLAGIDNNIYDLFNIPEKLNENE
ncbi:hypothetical protein HQ489_04655 [Candidatus Woesearchaeota archaeon]|nr:hypothetical protein [Candidatus Woesearchaeota archaeon]